MIPTSGATSLPSFSYKSVKTAAGQHDASRRPQTRPRWEPRCIECGTEIGTPEDLSGRDTSDDKTTTDRRVPEGHSAVYCSSPPGRGDSNVFLQVLLLAISISVVSLSFLSLLLLLLPPVQTYDHPLLGLFFAVRTSHWQLTFTLQLSFTLRLLLRQITSFIRITLVLPGQHTTCHLVLLLRAQKLMLHF